LPMRETAKFLTWAGLIISLPTMLPAVELTLRIPPAKAIVGTEIRVPIAVENAADLGAVEIDLEYPPNILEFINLEPGSLKPGMLDFNIVQPGLLRIGSISEPALQGNGDLFVMAFKVIGPGTASLDFRRVIANEGSSGAEIATKPESGTVTAQAAVSAVPPAAGAARGTDWMPVVGAVIIVELFAILVGIGLILWRLRSGETKHKKTRSG